MWHASVSFKAPRVAHDYKVALRKALRGVGRPDMEWVEKGNRKIWHCRRRLTDAEQEFAGSPVDIRGTVEHVERAAKAQSWLPNFGLPQLLEIG